MTDNETANTYGKKQLGETETIQEDENLKKQQQQQKAAINSLRDRRRETAFVK